MKDLKKHFKMIISAIICLSMNLIRQAVAFPTATAALLCGNGGYRTINRSRDVDKLTEIQSMDQMKRSGRPFYWMLSKKRTPAKKVFFGSLLKVKSNGTDLTIGSDSHIRSPDAGTGCDNIMHLAFF